MLYPADDLVCWQRDAGDPEPPGCTGINLNWSTDFCVRPPNNGENGRASDQGESVPVPTLPVPAPASVAPVTPAPTPTPSFQLKLYWELGYDWQDEYTETFWCLTRDIPDETCWHGLTRIVCVSTETYVTRCRNNDRQQWQFEYVNNDEALIRAAGTNRCLERSGWDINLVQCDASNSRQHFYAVRGGFNQDRFEIGQKSMRDFCMSQVCQGSSTIFHQLHWIN